MERVVRGCCAWFIGVFITVCIPLISVVLSTLYWCSGIFPLIRYLQKKPNPCIRLMYFYTAAMWYLCYQPILKTRLVFTELDPRNQLPLSARRSSKKLHIHLSHHPSTFTLFPFIFSEMKRTRWLNIAVKMEMIGYPYGFPGFLSGCFTFIIRQGKGTLKKYTHRALRRRVRNAIERGIHVMLFGDGSRFSTKKLAKMQASKGIPWLRNRAQQLTHVLPERYKGMQTILQEADTLNADVCVEVSIICTAQHTNESLLKPWRLVGEPIYVFRMNVHMTPEKVPEEMRELWDFFNQVIKNPLKYVSAQ